MSVFHCWQKYMGNLDYFEDPTDLSTPPLGAQRIEFNYDPTFSILANACVRDAMSLRLINQLHIPDKVTVWMWCDGAFVGRWDVEVAIIARDAKPAYDFRVYISQDDDDETRYTYGKAICAAEERLKHGETANFAEYGGYQGSDRLIDLERTLKVRSYRGTSEVWIEDDNADAYQRS